MVDKHAEECECDKPEIRESFKGDCSEKQIVECHGREMLEKLKNEGKIQALKIVVFLIILFFFSVFFN